MQLGNEYHYYEPSATKWYLVDEFGERTNEVTYGPCGASAILANGHAKLVDAKDVKFKQKDYWPKAWAWTSNSFFYQENADAPLAFYDTYYDLLIPSYSYYKMIPHLDDKNKPHDYSGNGFYTKNRQPIPEDKMEEFLNDVKINNKLNKWLQ